VLSAISVLLKLQNLVLLRRIPGAGNTTATTKTRRTTSYTKELLQYFFVILRALCVLVPKRSQMRIRWRFVAGEGELDVPDTVTGPCYILWAKPIWTSLTEQNGLIERRSTRLSENHMTPHRLDLVYEGADTIEGATSRLQVADRIYRLVDQSPMPNVAAQCSGGDGKRADHWDIWRRAADGRFVNYVQCRELSTHMERMLVMQGIDARWLHTFVPNPLWANKEPVLLPPQNMPRNRFPSGIIWGQSRCCPYLFESWGDASLPSAGFACPRLSS